MHRSVVSDLKTKTSWVRSEAGRCIPSCLDVQAASGPRQPTHFIGHQAGPTVVMIIVVRHLPSLTCITSRLQRHLLLGEWWLHGLLQQAEKRKLAKSKARFKFWPPLECVCFSACTWAFFTTYWQTLTFLKVSVFATFKTAPWLRSAMGHLHLPPTLQTRLCLLWGRSLTALPLKHRDGTAVTFSFEVPSLSKGLSTQGLALAAFIFFPLFSFNSRDRHELILAMTPTSLEMSISSNPC